jgi:hypothetical protein
MARRVAIAIGVEQSKGLVPLPGALRGADDFARWAKGQGFEVVPISDRGGPVRARDIFDAVNAAVSARDVEALFIFFAGHGVSKGLDVDFWLLSAGPTDPNEAVNVAASLRTARRCGVPHVAIFSDACRTMAGKSRSGIEGTVIFPDLGIHQRMKLDEFYAAPSGDVSHEVIPAGLSVDEAREKAFGIFSRCLLESLTGNDPVAIEEVAGARAVTSHRLEDALWEAVPVAAEEAGAASQRPDTRPESVPPLVLARLGMAARPAVIAPPPPDGAPLHRIGPSETGGPPSPTARGSWRAAVHNVIEELAREWAQFAPRDKYETRTGLTVFGAGVKEAFAPQGHEGVFEEGGGWCVRGKADLASSLLLLLDDGRWAAAALFPGFTGTLIVTSRGVEHLAYEPSRNDEGWRVMNDAKVDPSALREATARAALAVRSGRFEVALDHAEGLARQLRMFKLANPALGVLAAYAYDRAGRTDEVRDMCNWFLDAGQVVPHDVAFLADALGRPGIRVAPAYPLLTQGWAYLDRERIHPALREARRSLAPSLWASPGGEGAEALARAISEGELP